MVKSKEMIEDFGIILREKRIQKNLTQEKVSELAGITDVYLRDLERGNYTATWQIWMRLCVILDIDISEMQKRLKTMKIS